MKAGEFSNHVIVIGGGAAGFFAAINLAEQTRLSVTILEKNTKLLSKVKISGGGRCNVTFNCQDNQELVRHYPRGSKELRQVFSRFAVSDTIAWFKKHGVELKTEQDGRMFPTSDNSQTIIDCFLSLARKYSIEILTSCEVHTIEKKELFNIKTSKGMMHALAVICATGGHPKAGNYDFISRMGHRIDAPIPSLFTFNLPGDKIRHLQGLSVSPALVSLSSVRLNYEGPLLITHWGLSGPAVLRLSAFAAQALYDSGYEATVTVNWIHSANIEEAHETLEQAKTGKASTLVLNYCPFALPKRLWDFLLQKSEVDLNKSWSGLSSRDLRKLSEVLCKSTFHMKGKTTFKEEFVTAGGVNLKEIDFRTMESRIIPGLYFCGEVLNIDGITGGFNFQSAWSTAWVCASSVAATNR